MSLQAPQRRVHSINFEAATDDWVRVTGRSTEVGGTAGRSEVVRVALSELQRILTPHSRAEVMKFFLDHDVEWRLARLERPRIVAPMATSSAKCGPESTNSAEPEDDAVPTGEG